MVVNGQKGSHGDEAGILGEGERKEKGTEGAERLSISTRNSDPFFLFFFFCFFLFFLSRGEINYFFPVQLIVLLFLSARCSDHPANETTEETPQSKV